MSVLRAVSDSHSEFYEDPQGHDEDVAADASEKQPGESAGVMVSAAQLKLPLALGPRGSHGALAPAVWLVGAHGGAGVSTLAHVLAPAAESGMMWPVGERSGCCVVVCRSTGVGLEEAHDVLIQARSGLAGDVVVLGLVVVADAPGRTPKALEQKIAVLEQVVPKVWRVPYIEQWRLVEKVEDLPVWEPGAAPVRKRRRRVPPEVVPPAVGEIGQEMFDSFQQFVKKQLKKMR